MASSSSEAVRAVLAELQAQDPRPLLGWEGTTQIRLQAWAREIAESLHHRFPELGLVVGILLYPEATQWRPVDWDVLVGRFPVLDPNWISVAPDGPLAVASGFDARHRMCFVNRSDETVRLATNGQVTAHVIHPHTGRIVGVSAAHQNFPLIEFSLPPGERTVVPLIVGTASVDGSLGYGVPPGTWHLQAQVSISGPASSAMVRYLTPGLTFQIT